MLINKNFEADWGSESSHKCYIFKPDHTHYEADIGNIFTPPGWITWFYHDPNTFDQPEVRDAWKSGDPRRVHSGEKAILLFTFDRKHLGGFLQQVPTSIGTRLRFSAYAHAWSNHNDHKVSPHPNDPRWSEGKPLVGYNEVILYEEDIPPLNGQPQNDAIGNIQFAVGVDPTGGIDPFGEYVVWGEPGYSYNRHHRIPEVEAVAQSDSVTVFLRSTTLWAFRHNDAYWDTADLAATEVPPPPPPKCDHRGLPRIQYRRNYILLPPSASEHWINALSNGWDQYRATIGGSADDAGIGDLDERNVIAINSNEWGDNLEAFYTEHYPGVVYYPVETILDNVAADVDKVLGQIETEEPPPPPPPPPPDDAVRIGLHLQGGASGIWQFYDATQSTVLKAFWWEAVLDAVTHNPNIVFVGRHWLAHQEPFVFASDKTKAANDFIDLFRPSLISVAAQSPVPVYVCGLNEEIPSFNPYKLDHIIRFEMAFCDAVRQAHPNTYPCTFTAAVGNPHESEFELLLPLAQKCQETDGLFNYHCFSSDTDIMTSEGWINIAEYVQEFESNIMPPVASLNRNIGNVEYQSPIDVHEYQHNGGMVHIHSKIDVLVTENHRMWIRGYTEERKNTDDSINGFKFVEAQNLPATFEMKRDFGVYDTGDVEYFIIPQYESQRFVFGFASHVITYPRKEIDMDRWMEFFGYWVTEGYVGTNGYGINISQKEGDNLEKICSAIENIGYSPSRYKNNDTGVISLVFSDVQLGKYLKKMRNSHCKHIPRKMLAASRRQLIILFDAMMLGDGHYDRSGKPRYYCTASKRLADDFQELALKVGYTATMSKHCDGYYYVTLGTDRKTPRTSHKYIDNVEYKGKIYCVSVPNQLVFVRRNGKPSWQGNSYWWANPNESGLDSWWPYHAGRWQEMDKVFVANGIHVKWFSGECGAVGSADGNTLNPGAGWRHSLCYNGNWRRYEDDIVEYQRRVREWNSLNNSRFVGATIFTTSGPGWDDFEIRHTQMEALARVL